MGWLLLLCPTLIVTAFNFEISEKTMKTIVILCAILSCIGWLVGTVYAREFLLDMESIVPIVIEYGAELLVSLVTYAIMLLIAVCPIQKKSLRRNSIMRDYKSVSDFYHDNDFVFDDVDCAYSVEDGPGMCCKEENDSRAAPTNLAFTAHLLPMLAGKGNSVICPHGISAVLAMASEGADSMALREILYALDIDCIEDLRKGLSAKDRAAGGVFTSENALTLKRGMEPLHLLTEYKQPLKDWYNAEIKEDTSKAESSAELVNMATFKAQWLYKMTRDATYQRGFTNADNTVSHPAFLSCVEKELRAYVSSNGDLAAVSLPYKFNEKESPYVLTLVMSDSPINESKLEYIFQRMYTQKCTVRFPEFSIENEFDLVPMMWDLGVERIFDRKLCALDHICDQPLYASKFTQHAKIEVDKEGTVAKAVTYMAVTSELCLHEAKTIVFNRPFCYFLQDTEHNEILFAGKVNGLQDCEYIPEKVDYGLDFEAFAS